MAVFRITDPSKPESPFSYALPTIYPIPITGSKGQIYYIISADYGPGYPIIDTFILGQIASALNTRTDNLFVFLNP